MQTNWHNCRDRKTILVTMVELFVMLSLYMSNVSTLLVGKRLKHEILSVVTAYFNKSTFQNYSSFRHLPKGPLIYYVITCRVGGGAFNMLIGNLGGSFVPVGEGRS